VLDQRLRLVTVGGNERGRLFNVGPGRVKGSRGEWADGRYKGYFVLWGDR
jgi:hypothetical protein